MHFIHLQDWESEKHERTEGWGQTSSVTSPWSHPLGLMVYYITTFKTYLPYGYLLGWAPLPDVLP